jgi:hypothetical protein
VTDPKEILMNDLELREHLQEWARHILFVANIEATPMRVNVIAQEVGSVRREVLSAVRAAVEQGVSAHYAQAEREAREHRFEFEKIERRIGDAIERWAGIFLPQR